MEVEVEVRGGGAAVVGKSGCGRPYKYENASHPSFIGVRRVSSLKKMGKLG